MAFKERLSIESIYSSALGYSIAFYVITLHNLKCINKFITIGAVSSELPKWAEDEINSITDSSFKEIDLWEGTGYFLDIDEEKRRADIQFYEKLPIGKHIVTVEVPESFKISDFMKGFVYTYRVKILKAPFSEKLASYLKENLNFNMDGVYRFVLESLQMLEDVEADITPMEESDD